MLILDQSPILLSDRTGKNSPFDSLKSGDRILVLHDGIQESYPARTGVYALWKTGSGTVSDLPQSVLNTLAELGWQLDNAPDSKPFTAYESHTSWANYGDISLLWAASLYPEKAALNSALDLPLFRLDSPADLEAFKAQFSPHFSMDHRYDEIPSFTQATADMDQAFFDANVLFVTYVSSGSCSYRFGVDHISCDGSKLTIYAQQTNDVEVGDCAMAGWWLTVSVARDQLIGITAYDALFYPRTG